ncbi:glycosyltransferase family 9 protein [Uliginosibacterium paludis]|uniref:Glycosyltransferase family 9 protein n=1 Tax=Uliginosibacterium paludis TaxID=1615952 RepID=A0ABV2CT12_9RHOO
MSAAALPAPIARIAVFRALMLGDLLCAVPALRAIRAAHPAAQIWLIGLPWAHTFVERCPWLDGMIAFPGYPGLPETPFEAEAFARFLDDVRAHRFDLAIQLHGSGRITNPLLSRFGARHTAGFFDDEAWVPPQDAQRFVRWPEAGHEVERLLSLTDALGMPRQGRALEFPVKEEDRAALRALCPTLSAQPYVCIHAGSQLPSRRWLPERFAEVADALAAQGYAVVLSGSASEAPIAAAVRAHMWHPAISLIGLTSLWTLGALIEGAQSLICNDTGVSHIAAALGTPSVVISCGAEVARWAPPDPVLHTVLWADRPCRPCAVRICPEADGCAQAITAPEVLRASANRFRLVPVAPPEKAHDLPCA